MAVVNGDGPQPAGMFPGIANPDGTGAGGSAGSRTRPPDDAVPDGDTGHPGGSGNISPLREQAIDGRGASTSQPGQVDLGLAGTGPDPAYADSGAGRGSTFADQHRYPWQSQPGGHEELTRQTSRWLRSREDEET